MEAKLGMRLLNGLRSPSWQFGGLFDPGCELWFVEWGVRADVQPAGFLAALSTAGREWLEGGAFEEGDFDVAGEDVEGEEPAIAFDAVEGGVPFHGFVDRWDMPNNQCVQFDADCLFPAGQGGDVGLNGFVSVRFGDLRIAAGEEGDWFLF